MWPTRNDILQQDAYMLVSVWAGLLVVKAQGVEKLVLDYLVENAALAAQWHYLTTTTAPNKRVTPEKEPQMKTSGRPVNQPLC